MALSIGTLVGYLQLDDTNFNRKASAADRKLSSLRINLEALDKSNPKVKIQIDAQTAKIDEVKARIADLKAQAAKGVDVKVDMVRALMDLDLIQRKVGRLGHAEAKIKVDVEDKAALTKLELLQTKLSGLSSGFGMLGTSLVTLGPALVPIVAIAGGLAAALGAPLAAAGGGLTLFGFLAGKEISKTNKVAQQIDALKKNAAGLTSPTAQKAALAQVAALDASLSGPQQKFLALKTQLGATFSTLASGKTVFNPINAGLSLLNTILPHLKPLLSSVSGALTDVFGSLNKAAKNGSLDHLISMFAALAGPTIRGTAKGLGNIATGMLGISKAFAPVTGDVGKGLLKMTQQFAKVGSSKGLHDFVGYVHREGPVVASTLGKVVKAITHIAEALAPIGHVSLGALGKLSDGISKVPTNVITAIAAAIISVNLALKGLAAISAVTAAIQAVSTALIVMKDAALLTRVELIGLKVAELAGAAASGVMAAAQWALNAAMDANPIGLVVVGLAALVVGLVYAYKHSETFRNIVNAAFRGIAAVATWMWNTVLQPVLHFYVDALGHVMVAIGHVLEGMGHFIPGASAAGAAMIAAGHAAEGLANKINKIPDHKTVSLTFDGMSASAAIARIKAELASIPTTMRTAYYVTQMNRHNKGPVTGPGSAGGGTVAGQRMPYGDKVLTPTAPGEEIISNDRGQADKNRAALKAANAGALIAVVPGMAAGGTVRHKGATLKQREAAFLAAWKKRQRLHLNSLSAEMSTTKGQLSNASQFAGAFAGNVFSAGLPTTREIPGVTSTRMLNGVQVTETGAAQTVPLSNAQMLAQMMGYQSGQYRQARTLVAQVAKLRKEGISSNLLAQMQGGGTQGIAQIGALASGTRAQVSQFNRLNAGTNTALGNMGAQAYAGTSMANLQKRQQAEATMVSAIKRGLIGATVTVHGGKLRITGA